MKYSLPQDRSAEQATQYDVFLTLEPISIVVFSSRINLFNGTSSFPIQLATSLTNRFRKNIQSSLISINRKLLSRTGDNTARSYVGRDIEAQRSEKYIDFREMRRFSETRRSLITDFKWDV